MRLSGWPPREIEPRMPFVRFDPPPVSLLYVPGHKARALEKARMLPADMIIIDLEDAVPVADKALAREQAAAAISAGFAGKLVAVRINRDGGELEAADLAMTRRVARLDAIVLPKVEQPAELERLLDGLIIPLIPMVESARAIFAARDIAAHPRVVALFAGVNDLAKDLRLPEGQHRAALTTALQMLVLAARAEGKLVYDGVWNRIDDLGGFKRDAAEGWSDGFDGKTLIHPDQVVATNATWGPTPDDMAEARELVAAHHGGATRFGDRMIEDMHVRAAERLILLGELRAARRKLMG